MPGLRPLHWLAVSDKLPPPPRPPEKKLPLTRQQPLDLRARHLSSSCWARAPQEFERAHHAHVAHARRSCCCTSWAQQRCPPVCSAASALNDVHAAKHRPNGAVTRNGKNSHRGRRSGWCRVVWVWEARPHPSPARQAAVLRAHSSSASSPLVLQFAPGIKAQQAHCSSAYTARIFVKPRVGVSPSRSQSACSSSLGVSDGAHPVSHISIAYYTGTKLKAAYKARGSGHHGILTWIALLPWQGAAPISRPPRP